MYGKKQIRISTYAYKSSHKVIYAKTANSLIADTPMLISVICTYSVSIYAYLWYHKAIYMWPDHEYTC